MICNVLHHFWKSPTAVHDPDDSLGGMKVSEPEQKMMRHLIIIILKYVQTAFYGRMINLGHNSRTQHSIGTVLCTLAQSTTIYLKSNFLNVNAVQARHMPSLLLNVPW